MSSPIPSNVGPASSVSAQEAIGRLAQGRSEGDPFQQVMTSMVGDVNNQHLAADEALNQLVSGQSDNVHDVVLSMAKADLAFRLVLEIRNQLTDSYQEIMRMQV